MALDDARASEAVGRRNPVDIGQTERRGGVQGNRPVIRGTRVPVESALELASQGYSAAEIVRDFPSVVIDDVTMVLAQQPAT